MDLNVAGEEGEVTSGFDSEPVQDTGNALKQRPLIKETFAVGFLGWEGDRGDGLLEIGTKERAQFPWGFNRCETNPEEEKPKFCMALSIVCIYQSTYTYK